jgi:hypothetical protein
MVAFVAVIPSVFAMIDGFEWLVNSSPVGILWCVANWDPRSSPPVWQSLLWAGGETVVFGLLCARRLQAMAAPVIVKATATDR